MSEVWDTSTVMKSIRIGAFFFFFWLKPLKLDELEMIWIHVFKNIIMSNHKVQPWLNERKKKRMKWAPELQTIFDDCFLELGYIWYESILF